MTKDFAKLACSIGKRLRERREPVESAPLSQKLEELLGRLAERESACIQPIATGDGNEE
jgi:hypothetical protein